VVPKLGTTNYSGSKTSPVDTKIIIGGPHTHREWGGSAGSINPDACFDTCVPGQQSDSQFLGSLEVLILAVTHSHRLIYSMLDAVPPIHAESSHVATDKGPLQVPVYF